MSRNINLSEEDFGTAIEEAFHEGKVNPNPGLRAFVEYKYCIPSVLDEEPFSLETLSEAIVQYAEYFDKGKCVLFINHEEMTTIFTNPEFSNLLDPVTKYETIETGKIATILNVPVYTDAYLDPKLHYVSKACLRFKFHDKVVEATTKPLP